MSIRQQDLASRVEWLWRERLRGEEEGVETVQGINRWANTKTQRRCRGSTGGQTQKNTHKTSKYRYILEVSLPFQMASLRFRFKRIEWIKLQGAKQSKTN